MSRPRNNAFTLIEMIILIMIIAVMSSVAAPAFSRFHTRQKFRQVVEDVRSLLAGAQQSALQTGSDCIVQFNQQSEVFTAAVDNAEVVVDMPSAMQETAEHHQQVQPRVLRLPDSVGVSDFQVLQTAPDGTLIPVQNAQPIIRFYSDGTADAARIAIMSNTDGYTLAVRVDAANGTAIIMDAIDEAERGF
jgi:Tfp pilus assembly protein FimT